MIKVKKTLLLAAVFLPVLLFVSCMSAVSPYSSSGGINVSKARVSGKKIIVTDEKGKSLEYKIKGVCYAPDIAGSIYCANYRADVPLIKALGANSIRTYRPLGCYSSDGDFDAQNSRDILDACLEEGITVAVGFSYEDMAEGGLMEQYLGEFGKHPAILMVVFGNEYNYHYDEWFSKKEWIERLGSAVSRAKELAPHKIVATVHGELPTKREYREYVNAGIELIMLNIYRGANFGFAGKNWYELTDSMPWVVGEFGRSSKDVNGNDTSKLQASYLQTLIRSMEQGYLFTFVDDPQKGEYEKSPNIGREDSLGVYDVDRDPKPAAKTVAAEYSKIKDVIYLD